MTDFNRNSASKTSLNYQEISFIFSYKLPCFSSPNWTFKRPPKLQFKTPKNPLEYSLILQRKWSFLQRFQCSLSRIFVIPLPKKRFSMRFFEKPRAGQFAQKTPFRKTSICFLIRPSFTAYTSLTPFSSNCPILFGMQFSYKAPHSTYLS